MKEKLIVAATGHRPKYLRGIKSHYFFNQFMFGELEELARCYLSTLKPTKVICGMATGWDTAVGWAAVNQSIPLTCAVPFLGQCQYWSDQDKVRYASLLNFADKVEVIDKSPTSKSSVAKKYWLRDKWMMDNSDHVVTLFNGDYTTGTGITVRYAESLNKEIDNLYWIWEKTLKKWM